MPVGEHEGPAASRAADYRVKRYDVFVSYKREDDAAREVLVQALEAAGYEVFWDAKLGVGDWREELRETIEHSTLVITLWSAQAAASSEVMMEAAGAYQLGKLMSAPIEDASVVPDQFKNMNLHFLHDWADEAARAPQLAQILETVRRATGGPSLSAQTTPDATIPVELGDLPPAPPRLIGRDAEMAMLRRVWANPIVNAVVLHALGGAGKSALLRAFVNEILAKNGDGAMRIYGWSAHSQGSGDQKRADADGFITRALADFGYAGPPIRDPVARARELARRIQQERVLLLLDGLEPLQDPPGVNRGRFKDKGLATLVKTLANSNPGLMVLTSRQEVPELIGAGPLVVHWPLERLTPAAGADLLVELGTMGRQGELEAAVAELDGHALSVTLLGTFLAEVCRGDVRQRDRFRFGEIILTPEEQESADETLVPAKRAAKVMAGYLEQFDALAMQAVGVGAPEHALLHLLGLFDRPADGRAVDMLLAERIEGLNDAFFVEAVAADQSAGSALSVEVREITPDQRSARLREAKSRLRKLRLLAKADADDPRGLDAHPVVRAYFAERLEQTAPEAAMIAHSKLYDFYCALPEDALPSTVEAMQPLLHAIKHGVLADRAQDAFGEILMERILRGNEYYLTRVHGGFAVQLAAVAQFYERPWTTPNKSLSDAQRAWLFNDAAFCLTSLGRLSEAIAPREAGLSANVSRSDWSNAAIAGGMLSDALLTLGQVPRAIETATAAIDHADRCDDPDQSEFRRTDLAAALHAGGDRERAAALFDEAEKLCAENTPEVPGLVSAQGYRYGDLLLAAGEIDQALERGKTQLDVAERFLGQGMGLDDIGFARLLIGRALDAQGADAAAETLDAAVRELRKAGMMDELPKALLARAAHRRTRAAAGEAALVRGLREDLAEVEEIAEPEMRLYLTDLALERARLALDAPAAFADATAARAEAEAQTAIAAERIAETGYRRREDELKTLRDRLTSKTA